VGGKNQQMPTFLGKIELLYSLQLMGFLCLMLFSIFALATEFSPGHRVATINNESYLTGIIENAVDRNSLFDQLFYDSDGKPGHYDIPYPFSRIVSRIESSLGVSINGEANLVRSVFIPLGRCINRHAASPNYFRRPRVIVGVDSEHYGEGGRELTFLKDKIYIGYQELANAMEVISYNEEKGQFDFQVVTDYRSGQIPEVNHIERSKCTGCHQNNGPIFPQPPWDETNNNREIFKRLTEAVLDPEGTKPVFHGSDASHIDGSSNRANLYSLYQQFWQGVCKTKLERDVVRCRAAIFEMVILSRLQENNRGQAVSNRISNYLYPASINGIEKQWPQGISILSSDIENQNPIQNGSQLHLASAQRLLHPRSLMIRWQPSNLHRVIEGLAQFISLADFRYLDSLLYQTAVVNRASEVKMQGQCQLNRIDDRFSAGADSWQTGDIAVNCELRDGVFSKPYHFLGEFYFESGNVQTFPIAGRLILDSPGDIMGLTHSGGNIEPAGNNWKIDINLLDSKRQFHARLPGGDIAQKIEIRWPKENSADQLFSKNSSVLGSATLTVLSGYEILDSALLSMIEIADMGDSDLFSSKPFRGKMMMKGLFHELE
jgi:hypothetical protein